MKPTGKLIISFPICTDQDTIEYPFVTTDEKRIEYYGQRDHVRLFGRDYLEKISGFGFNIEEYIPKECCSQKDIERYGFIEDDVLMICTMK